MHIFIEIFGLHIASYGLMITLGVLFANIIAFFVARKLNQDFNDVIILEGYSFLGAFLGAKLLYLAVAFRQIEWSRITDIEYFQQLMQGGFVFYGGFIGGIAAILLAGRIHKIRAVEYIRTYIFLIPMIHCFGRIGCFLAGCCYGVPYRGVGAVTFPEGGFAPAGVKLFPVQLVEAGCLLVISACILVLVLRRRFEWTIEMYLLLYAITRFVLENFRYDAARGMYFGLSTSQWISIGMVAFAVFLVKRRRVRKS
ncbi:phosphatidylglycerol:prolipoprotein diacylglycerol transferase [Lachnospiraceae bacterium A10]|nr:phosphatidylglycerol:prolipoprotein diacylglycerol transferase [Lachnospiraceae bacterium A10]